MTDCADPGQVANAARAGPTSLTPGGTVTYTCIPGYIIQGTQNTMVARATCQTNLQWSLLPFCVPAVTGRINFIENDTLSCSIKNAFTYLISTFIF